MIENDKIIKFLKGLKHLEDVASVTEIMAESFKENTGVAIRLINCEWINHYSDGTMDKKLTHIKFDME